MPVLPSEEEYFQCYGLTEARLRAAAPDVIVMHPGPINRGIEIDSQVADGDRSVILQQVSHGIAIRMAVMALVMGVAPGARSGRGLMRMVIRNGRLLCPGQQLDELGDLYISAGRIVSAGRPVDGFSADHELALEGQWVCPGIVDLGVHTREPGFEHKATIASETEAAVRAGVTSMVCPPTTRPVTDNPSVVELVHQRQARLGKTRIYPLGALTRGLEGTPVDGSGRPQTGRLHRPVQCR